MTQTHEHEPAADARPRVVVGVDGSPGSIAALRAGEWAAAARGGTLVAVTSWSPSTMVPRIPGPIPDLRTPAEETLRLALAEAFGERALIPIRTVVSPSPSVGLLLAEARDADLLVVGSRGHGGVAGLLLGSVSMACAAQAPCPVLIVHPADRLPTDGGSRPQARVVVGVGGVSDSEGVLLLAAEAAAELDAELLAVASFDDTAIAGDFRDELRDAAVTALQADVAQAFGDRRPARLRVEAIGGSAAGILVDRSRSADLVVIGRATRGEIAGVVLGAVSLSVAERAQSPVLVVPPGARVARRARATSDLATALL